MVFNMNIRFDALNTINKQILQQNGVPIYVQLVQCIRKNIESGVWPLGERLPSLERMADAFGVSRVTMRQAIQALVQLHLLVSSQGRGTFIVEQLSQRPYEIMKTSWEELIHKIEGTKVRMLEEKTVKHCPFREPFTAVARPDAYHYMKRIHSHGDSAYAVIEVYLDEGIFRKAPEQFRTLPVLPVLGAQKIAVIQARQLLTIESADSEAAQLLDLPMHAPVAHVQRFAVDASESLFYVGNVIYRGDYIKLDIDLRS